VNVRTIDAADGLSKKGTAAFFCDTESVFVQGGRGKARV